MRTLILVIASAITAYGQSCDAAKSASPAQPNQASCASAQPKQAPLSEVQQLTVEKIQAQLQLTKIQERDLQTQLQGVIDGKCRELGGGSAQDCNVLPPSEQQPRYVVMLRPKLAAAVKEEKK